MTFREALLSSGLRPKSWGVAPKIFVGIDTVGRSHHRTSGGGAVVLVELHYASIVNNAQRCLRGIVRRNRIQD
jgi:hypothetical protein